MFSINDENLYEKVEESLVRNSFALVTDAYSLFELELITHLFRMIEEEAPQKYPEWCSWKNRLCCMNRLKALFSHVFADQAETSTL